MLLLDRAYATGFAWAAYKSGDLVVAPGSEGKIEHLDDAVRELFRPREAAKRSRAALELATIHDQVFLHALPGGYHFAFRRLASEGVIAGVSGVGAISSDRHWETGYLGKRLTPAMSYLVRSCRSSVRLYRDSDVTRVRPDTIRTVAVSLLEFLDEAGINSGDSLTILYRSFYQFHLRQDGPWLALERLMTNLSQPLKLSVDTVALIVIELLSHAMSVITLDGFSQEEGLPYVSDIHGTPHASAGAGELYLGEAYELCCLVMREVVQYVPVVSSVDDMLRLRNDRRIVAFRHALHRWSTALQKGTVDVLAEIRAEVIKRNCELQRLTLWRRADEWLYWTSLPLDLIPIISTIHNVISFGVRWKIEHSAKTNWLCLGR